MFSSKREREGGNGLICLPFQNYSFEVDSLFAADPHLCTPTSHFVLDSFKRAAIVVEGSDGVFDLIVAYQMDVTLRVTDEREENALYLHEGRTEAGELNLARRVDCSNLLGLHVQDNPI